MLKHEGFEILRGVFSKEEVERFRIEADAVCCVAGSACVRHLREQSPLFSMVSQDERLSAHLSEGTKVVRSILFDKTPDENWPVPWHQDLTIAVRERVETPEYGPWSVKDGVPHVQPPLEVLEKMVTARIHLDKTTVENGALWVVPGSHCQGKIASNALASHTEAGAVACECGPGDVLLMSPLILHSSRRSLVPSHRRIVHFEYAEGVSLHPNLAWYE